MKKKLAKRIALILLFFAIACMELGAHPFKIGEKLTYTVKLFLFPVGEQILEVKEIAQINGQLTYHLCSRVKTSGWADLLLSYNHRLESFVDVDTLYPCQIKSYAQEENSPPKDIIVQIDQKKGVASMEDREKVGDKTFRHHSRHNIFNLLAAESGTRGRTNIFLSSTGR